MIAGIWLSAAVDAHACEPFVNEQVARVHSSVLASIAALSLSLRRIRVLAVGMRGLHRSIFLGDDDLSDFARLIRPAPNNQLKIRDCSKITEYPVRWAFVACSQTVQRPSLMFGSAGTETWKVLLVKLDVV